MISETGKRAFQPHELRNRCASKNGVHTSRSLADARADRDGFDRGPF